MYEYSCVIKRIIDGDTVVVDIDLGFDVWLNNQHIRLSGIDAPEIRTRDLPEKERGILAKKFVEFHLPVGETKILRTYEFNEKGKYGRIIGNFLVYNSIADMWVDMGMWMIEEGLALKYEP